MAVAPGLIIAAPGQVGGAAAGANGRDGMPQNETMPEVKRTKVSSRKCPWHPKLSKAGSITLAMSNKGFQVFCSVGLCTREV